jgi:hypothetical protein
MPRPATCVYATFALATVRRLSSERRLAAFPELFRGLPAELVPTHWGSYEPIRTRFDLERVSDLHSALCSPTGGEVLFARRGRPSGSMSLSGLVGPRVGENRMSFELALRSEEDAHLFDAVQRLFERAVDWADAAWAGFGLACHLRGGGWDADYVPQRKCWNGQELFEWGPAQATLACVPHFHWITVLGREFVEHLGAARLSAVTVAERAVDARCAGGGRMWIRVTERPEEMFGDLGQGRLKDLRAAIGDREVLCRAETVDELISGGVRYDMPQFDRSEIDGRP